MRLCVGGFRNESCGLLQLVQTRLGALIRACFIDAGRDVAHRAAKLIALCLE